VKPSTHLTKQNIADKLKNLITEDKVKQITLEEQYSARKLRLNTTIGKQIYK
jgi:hypothetical protein